MRPHLTKPRFRIQSRERQRNYDSIPYPSYPYPRLQPAPLSAMARPATMCCRGALDRARLRHSSRWRGKNTDRPRRAGAPAARYLQETYLRYGRAAEQTLRQVRSSRARKALKIASRPRLSDAAARETRSRSNCSLLFAVVRAGTKNNAAWVNKAGEIHANAATFRTWLRFLLIFMTQLC